MTIKTSAALRNGMLQGTSLKELLDGGFLYYYAGAEPADADAALDMAAVHTQIVKIAADAVPVDNGVTGLTFSATAALGALAKSAAQTWAGKINFVGKDAALAGTSPLTAVFYRFCSAADNGQAVGDSTKPRIQGSVGIGGTDIVVTSASYSDNGINTTGLSVYEARLPAY